MIGYLVTGGALLVGATVYGLYKYYQNRSQAKTSTNSSNINEKKVVVPNVDKVNSDADEIIISEFKKNQTESSNSIKERHQAASQYIKETLEEMVTDNEEFENKINQVNNDLDDLLK